MEKKESSPKEGGCISPALFGFFIFILLSFVLNSDNNVGGFNLWMPALAGYVVYILIRNKI